MRDYDAELRKLREKANEVRKAKALAQRRADEKLGKALRNMFPDVPDDASMLREYLENWKNESDSYSENSSTTDDDEYEFSDTEGDETEYESSGESRGAQRPLGQCTYRR